MIFRIVIILNLLFCYKNLLAQGLLDEKASIKLVAYAESNQILLRWAMNTPNSWNEGNKYGFLVEKTLISRNNQPVLPLQKKLINGTAFLPAPLKDWEEPFDRNEFAAVIAQSLYGESFETGNMDPIQSVMAVNEELEQRFTFALLAAEQSFEAAQLAGWGYIDNDVSKGEKYFYRVSCLDENGNTIAKEASVYTGIDFYTPLPKPIDVNIFFQENKAELYWDYSSLKDTYTSYMVERSTDGLTFKKANTYPIFSAEKPKAGKQMFLSFTDSIPNGKEFYYRVKGINSFNKVGPPSKVVKGKALKRLKYVPYITGKQIVNDSTVVLQWEFDKKANSLIKGFDLLRSNNDRTDFKKVISNISPNQRSTTYKGLKRINYFKIVAKAKNGDERPSYATIVQPVDSIPPAIPIGLKGSIDTLGVVQLSWEANKEFDLKGYRVFRANNLKEEFSPVTSSIIKQNKYIDTINIKNLNKQIHYKIWAEDDRYNASKLSKVLSIDKPDLYPPSPAVIDSYKYENQSVNLHWIKSSSDDVEFYLIYRLSAVAKEKGWLLLSKLENDIDVFNDSTLVKGDYKYIVVAKDKSGLESQPSQPITLNIKSNLREKIISRFLGFSNRNARSIQLSWKVDRKDISEILLYKSQEENPLRLYKTFDANTMNFEDQHLKINTKYNYGLKIVLNTGVESKLKTIDIKY